MAAWLWLQEHKIGRHSVVVKGLGRGVLGVGQRVGVQGRGGRGGFPRAEEGEGGSWVEGVTVSEEGLTRAAEG